MVRIVHTGDMHLDSPFKGLPRGVAQLRKEEQRETFLRLMEETKAYHADILLIAGDLFDSRYVSGETVAFLKEAFSRIPETAVFVAPGNHDFLAEDSRYRTEDFGENVHIFGEKFEAVTLGEVTVYGVGFPSRYVKESMLPPDGVHTGEGIGILLMHGDVAGESDYNPISVAGLSQSGVQYAALGHVHTFSEICHAGKTAYAYPGILEGRHFDEGDEGGYIRGEISKEGVNLAFVPIAKRRNETCRVDITDLGTTEEIKNKIKSVLSLQNLYKIVLCGEISGTLYIDTALLQKELGESCLYIKIQDETTTRTDGEEESLLEKLFAQRLRERTDRVGQMALRLGLDALRRQKR